MIINRYRRIKLINIKQSRDAKPIILFSQSLKTNFLFAANRQPRGSIAVDSRSEPTAINDVPFSRTKRTNKHPVISRDACN